MHLDVNLSKGRSRESDLRSFITVQLSVYMCVRVKGTEGLGNDWATQML